MKSDVAGSIHKVIAKQMMERRTFVKRPSPVILEVGASTGWFLRHMLEEKKYFGCKQYIQCDISEDRLNENYKEVKHLLPPSMELVQICCDEEQSGALELPDRTVDMAVTSLNMHWVNDLETAMVNIRKSMKKDAFLLMSMFGGNTLFELRSAFSLSNMESEGGLSPHVSPMIDGAGMSSLMLQSGFALPSIDMDRFVLLYETPFHLMEHLHAMGESACHVGRRTHISRTSLLAMAAVYQSMYEHKNLIPATFEVFHTIAWSPSPNQPQPLERGSANVSLASVGGGVHRKFTEAVKRATNNPGNKEYQEEAEQLFLELQAELDEQRERLGEDVVETTSSRESPAPPFQANKEKRDAKFDALHRKTAPAQIKVVDDDGNEVSDSVYSRPLDPPKQPTGPPMPIGGPMGAMGFDQLVPDDAFVRQSAACSHTGRSFDRNQRDGISLARPENQKPK